MSETLTAWTRETVTERARQIVARHLQCSPAKVTEAADFVADLGADSLDFIELTVEFEEAFDLTIPDEAVEAMKTFGDAADALARRLAVSA